jgi:hypothetical protein
VALPSPRLFDTSICKSGRTDGWFGLLFNTRWPGGSVESPGAASTTTRNPKPLTTWNTGTGSLSTGVVVVPSADAMPMNGIVGPVAPL